MRSSLRAKGEGELAVMGAGRACNTTSGRGVGAGLTWSASGTAALTTSMSSRSSCKQHDSRRRGYFSRTSFWRNATTLPLPVSPSNSRVYLHGHTRRTLDSWVQKGDQGSGQREEGIGHAVH